MPADLRIDTSVVRVLGAGQKYVTDLPNSWDWRLPSGGVLMTVGLRAIREAIADDGFFPMSATTIFCQPVPAGRIDIDVDVLRRGKGASQLRASLRTPSADGVCLEVSATFVRERTGPKIDFVDPDFPDVPPPEEARPFQEQRKIDGKVTGFRIFENLDTRLALGNVWWEPGWSAGTARFARWIRYKVPQTMPNGYLDPLALPPIIDMMPSALRQKMGPDGPRYYAPSLDLTVHFLDPTTSEWLLIVVYARRARGGYATAEAEVWSEDRRLVAYATQTMFLIDAEK